MSLSSQLSASFGGTVIYQDRKYSIELTDSGANKEIVFVVNKSQFNWVTIYPNGDVAYPRPVPLYIHNKIKNTVTKHLKELL